MFLILVKSEVKQESEGKKQKTTPPIASYERKPHSPA